jgi:hypothetical protein
MWTINSSASVIPNKNPHKLKGVQSFLDWCRRRILKSQASPTGTDLGSLCYNSPHYVPVPISWGHLWWPTLYPCVGEYTMTHAVVVDCQLSELLFSPEAFPWASGAIFVGRSQAPLHPGGASFGASG